MYGKLQINFKLIKQSKKFQALYTQKNKQTKQNLKSNTKKNRTVFSNKTKEKLNTHFSYSHTHTQKQFSVPNLDILKTFREIGNPFSWFETSRTLSNKTNRSLTV